ncbi:MAG TPA: LysO family transporter [Thermotogota bacterium]|nr:LysO family transporter [Thermotogota bacterium]HRW91944.1 LysO family transporter [Thermotogota bacterium]
MFLLILAAFAVGLLLGMRGHLQKIKRMKLVLPITLFLLFVMGFELGTNEELVRQLPKIGWMSLSIALLASLGSFLAAFFLERLLRKVRKGWFE